METAITTLKLTITLVFLVSSGTNFTCTPIGFMNLIIKCISPSCCPAALTLLTPVLLFC